MNDQTTPQTPQDARQDTNGPDPALGDTPAILSPQIARLTLPPQPEPTDPSRVIRHGRCGRWWTGTEVGHCAQCHREFSGEQSFTRHQTHDDNGRVICHDPATRGLVARTKPWGLLWGRPGPDDAAAERIRNADHAEATA